MKNRLRELRQRAGISQQQLAVKARMNPSTLTMIERYGYIPGAEVRLKIAKALKTTESELFPED